jgi:NTE family protein
VTRALVLGGGGITGIAWETGLLLGLARAGVDLADADRLVGTSAGSVVGAQLASGTSLEELYATQLEDPAGEIAASVGRLLVLRWAATVLVPGSRAAKRARLGRAAVRAASRPGAVPEAERIAVIRGRVPTDRWPDRDLRITTVDAQDGRFVVLDRHGEVDLVHAVAASCAVPLVWPPVTVAGRRYVDGGVRSATNADVAEGAERAVVVAPLPRSLSRHHAIGAQLARAGVRRSAVLSPDAAALAAIGKNVLDPARRRASAEAGLAQAAAVAEEVRAVWLG